MRVEYVMWSWMGRFWLCCALMCGIAAGSVGCAGAQQVADAPKPAPQDLFEPLRAPYRKAFTATHHEDRLGAKGGVQEMLKILEGLKTSAPASWPAAYQEQPELVQEAIELFLNQTKVAGALNITGEYQEAHQTLEELGEFLRRVRSGLGVEHPTDKMLVLYMELKALQRVMVQPQLDEQAQRAYVEAIDRQVVALMQTKSWPDKSCQELTLWEPLLVLKTTLAAQERALMEQAVSLARNHFYSIFGRCG